MQRNSFKISLLLPLWLIVAVLAGSGFGDTWHLTEGQNWENVEQTAKGQYMLSVANIKQLISSGRSEEAQAALELLKNDYSEIAGAELDAFMAAEILYSKRKWVKAVQKYDEFLDGWPDSGLYESAIEREYSIAVAFLGGQKRRRFKIFNLSGYDEAKKIMRGISDRVGNAPIGYRALESLARGFEKRERYYEAWETWNEIESSSTGELRKQSLLGMARNRHQAYNGRKYDSSSLIGAQTYYREYYDKFGDDIESEKVDEEDIGGKLTTIEHQLADKQLAIGEYYERTGSIGAAKLYYRQVIEKWPNSTAAKKANEYLAGETTDKKPVRKKRKFKRHLFDAGNVFLDSWFGLSKLIPNKTGNTSETVKD